MRRRPEPTVSAGGRTDALVRWVSNTGLCAAALLAVILLSPVSATAKKTPRAPAAAGPPPVSVAIDRAHPGAPVPQDFLGLSFELSSLHQLAGYGEAGNLVALLRSLGPGVLRFGGGSADTRVAWTDAVTPRPAWASSVVDVWDFRELATLAANSGWHVVLTVGVGHYDPVAAAREVAAAKAALGGWLTGIQLGNEPNAFAQHGLRAEPWTFIQYSAEVTAYRSAIEAAVPGIPVSGPDVSGSSGFESWGLGEAIDQRPAELTGHHYPLGCEQTPRPSITRLLSPLINRKEIGSLRRYMTIAHASKTPFRLDEVNSVSCGGVAGVSDTFASALWAVGYLPHVMSAGVVGVNMHGNPSRCNGYSPICAPTPEALANGTLVAQPEWYALLLAKQLLGDRPLPTIVGARRGHNLQATALLAVDGRLHVVIADDDLPGRRPMTVRLHVGSGFARASVLALTGPSPAALSGVALGGATVSADGSWSALSVPTVAARNGAVTVSLQPSSAALVTVSPQAR